MLKISNKSRKNEQLETMATIDKCTKIMKEDRLALRQLVKDENIKLMELVAKHKKKTDLTDLQTELRKFLKEKKGVPDEPIQPIILRKVKSKERYEWAGNVRSPSRSHLDFRKKHKDDLSSKKQDSTKEQSAQKSQRNQLQDNKILDELQVQEPKKSLTQPFSDDLTPIKMEFQTIVSQAPLNQSEQRSECILQYNVAELQQYMEDDKHYVSKCVYKIPELQSLSYKHIAPLDYQDLFTDWGVLFQYQSPQYTIRMQHELPDQIETKESTVIQNNSQLLHIQQQINQQQYHQQQQKQQQELNLKLVNQQHIQEQQLEQQLEQQQQQQEQEQNQNQKKQLEIRGVTAEELFTYLVHNRFSKRLNFYQIKENARQSIPDAQIDFELLFKLADTDLDGWITLQELGTTLKEACSEKEEKPNKIKQLYDSLDGLVNKETFINALNDKIQAEILYHEIDLFGKGSIGYWEMYNHFEEIEQFI